MKKLFCDIGADFFHVSMNFPPNSGIVAIVIYTQISHSQHTVYAMSPWCNIREEFGVTKSPPPPTTAPAQ